MAFSRGDKVRLNSQPDAYEVVAGPDTGKNYCVQNASGRLLIRPALDLSPLPRTLAEVEPGVACRVPAGGVVYRDYANVAYNASDHPFPAKCLGKPDVIEISEVLGPVRTVIEGRE